MKLKMRIILLKIIALFFFILLISCNKCKETVCLEDTFELSFFIKEHGKAFIQAGDLEIVLKSNVANSGLHQTITNIGNQDSIFTIELQSDIPYGFEVNSRAIGTLEVKAIFRGQGICCPLYELEEVKLDGEIICNEFCLSTIEIDL